ncbi:hypothetical protein LINGRAHAP2_LOCUS3254 [Linum grandiflorum]
MEFPFQLCQIETPASPLISGKVYTKLWGQS